MKSLEVIAILVVVGGLVLALAYPNEVSDLAARILNSIRWIHHDVPRNM